MNRKCGSALARFALGAGLLSNGWNLHAQMPIDTAAVARAVREEMARTGAPGASVAIVHDGRIVYAQGFGVVSSEQAVPVDAHTLFRIGSVTKPITALAALSLRDEGLLSLERPVGDYLPGLHPAVARVTMHDLLSHMAGIIALPSADGSHDDDALQRRMLSWTDTVLFADPGDVYSYSSPGYWLAGAVIERVTGQWYADVLRARVFDPLGMTRSSVRPLAAFTWPTALDHRRTADGVVVTRPYPDDVSTWPGGSVFSSAAELARLALHLLGDGDEAAPTRAVVDMRRPQAVPVSSNCAYTYGLSHCSGPEGTTLSHYGFRSGSGAVFTLIPEHRAAVIILANIAFGIFGQSEAAALRMLGIERAGPSPAPRAPTAAERIALAGAYAAGRDTLFLRDDSAALWLSARGATYALQVDGSDPQQVLMLGDDGRIMQVFRIVTGHRTGSTFLHDGLNAFRRTDAAAARDPAASRRER